MNKNKKSGKYVYVLPRYLTDALFKEADETNIKPSHIIKQVLENHFLIEEEKH